MTKILIKQSIAGYEFAYRPGDIAELTDELAAAWIAGGIAERAPKTPKPEVAKAVVKPEVKAEVRPEFAVAKAPEVAVPVKTEAVEDSK